MTGLNGNGRKLSEAAADLGRSLAETGTDERVVNGFYLALVKRSGSRRLIVGHRDRRPSAEEALVVARAAGAPEGSEPQPSQVYVMCQDVRSKRMDTLEFQWRENA